MLHILLFASAMAHVAVLYNPAGLPIRNAAGPTSDGTYSTDTAGCGGVNTFGQNGVSTILQGSNVTLHFNYGTGNTGAHAESDNVFYAAFINLDIGQQQSDMFNAANQISGPVPAPAGSTTNGYTVQVTIPSVNCTQCVLSVYDQRKWGGCIDLQVVSSLNATPTFSLGWVPTALLATYNQGNCVGPNLQWFNGSTGGTSYCCPSQAIGCAGRCWIGDAPKQQNGVNLFADGTLCQGATLCNGTLASAFCSFQLNGQSQSKCTPDCGKCTSLCQTSPGYSGCQCVGSPAAVSTLAGLALVLATLIALL